jgi:bacterioferritin-associated ferredoxin
MKKDEKKCQAVADEIIKRNPGVLGKAEQPAGVTMKELARALEVSYDVVCGYCRRSGWTGDTKPVRLNRGMVNEITEAVKSQRAEAKKLENSVGMSAEHQRCERRNIALKADLERNEKYLIHAEKTLSLILELIERYNMGNGERKLK